MIGKFWFAPDIYSEFKDQTGTMNFCLNCVTEYLQDESKKHGYVTVDTQRFDADICSIVREALSSMHPHLRSIIGVTVLRTENRMTADVEVRFAKSYYTVVANNPGVALYH
jgi:hypothetical protein